MQNDEIKEIIEKYKDKRNRIKIKNLKKDHPEIIKIVNEYFNSITIDLSLDLNEKALINRKIYIFLNQLKKEDLSCKICGKPVTWPVLSSKGEFCSNDCRKKGGEYVAQKLIKTNLKNYGVVSTAKLERVKRKAKNTMFKKHKCFYQAQKKIKNFDKYYDKEFIIKNFLDKNNKFKLNDFCHFFNVNQPTAHYHLKRLDIEYKKSQGYSLEELEVLDFVKHLGFKPIWRFKLK